MLECLKAQSRLLLLAQRHGFEGQRLRLLVSHAETLKFGIRFACKVPRLGAQIQVEIKFGEIKIAERVMVAVADLVARHARRAEHVNRAAVFAAEEIQVCDVVVGLRNQAWHAVFLADLPRFLIGSQRLREFPHADQAHRQVT